jgi:ferredoxin
MAAMNTVVLFAGAVVAVLGFGVFFFGKRRSGDDEYGDTVPINVDPVRCARFGFCEHEAPDVFQIRREGRFTYKPAVPVEDIDRVIRAVEVCPARAIRVGGVHTWSTKRI